MTLVTMVSSYTKSQNLYLEQFTFNLHLIVSNGDEANMYKP